MRSKDALRLRIRELCAENGLTVNALSIRCGVTQSTLSNIVSGRNNSTTIHTVAKICSGLNIRLSEFFDSDLFRNVEQEIV